MGNRFGASLRYPKGIIGVLIAVSFFLTMLFMFNMDINYIVQTSEAEALESTRAAITRAMVQFYAIEGYYPPSIDYLIERYGLQIDLERFIVHYNAFASNRKPQVIVLLRD